MPGLNITSEIGTLKRVILHSPGPEVEAMTPKEAAQDLYNDIIPLRAVRAEHDQLRAFLGRVTTVYELKDLLAESLASQGSRFEFVTALSGLCPIRNRIDELLALHPAELAELVIEGLPALPSGLAGAISPRSFSMRPLPNAYFMRDTAAIFRDYAISSAVAFDVRLIESIITRFIFTRHPQLRARGLLLDGPRDRNRFITLEGGDVIVISPTVLAIGISERTTPDAIEVLAQSAGRAFDEPISLLVVLLPKERATIHLDMVFTVLDRDAALVYSPLVTGQNHAPVVRVDVRPDGKASFHEVGDLISGLQKLGHDFRTIPCGNGDPLYEDREQWLSGANSFAFAPGKILMYSCNAKTIDALSEANFAVHAATEFLSDGGDNPLDYERLVVTFDGIELARGGGGARCMTMPIERENL